MNTRPTRVLIIEGDSDDDALISSYLAPAPGSGENMVLAHASRLSTACQLLARQPFDAALLDLALPQTTGLDGLLKVTALKPSLPVIVLSGKRDESLAARALQLGAQDYFIKGSSDCLMLKRAVRYAIERKRLTTELEALLAADASPKLVLDSRNVVRFANPSVEPLLGRGPRELIDKPFGRDVPLRDSELVVPLAGARERRLRLHVSPIAWHGEPARLVSLADAAPRREPSPLESDPDDDLSVVEARNHFLSRISHELRNTLATMKTAAYCLKDDSEEKLTPSQAQMVDMISRNIDRQARIVENILDLARLRSGTLKIRLQQADASAIIADLAEEYRMSRGEHKLRVSVDGGLPSIACDPDLIAQVLRNLLDNAARYAKETIAISASRSDGGGITVSVTDDGSGIPEDRLGGLFTRFHRLDEPANGGARKGTGLGLAICREIIEGHHGRIRAENAAGSGARFSFELPLTAAPETPAARAPAEPGARSYLLHK
ncbi:MAG: ATP-binding protein [Elusimicrobia bacterium]|nr:ATP-binding protein [Elusimicrobiota bacterium]